MSIFPSRPPGPPAAGPSGRAGGVRLGVGTMAGLGVLAGVSSALVTLIGQARSTTRSIEAAAIKAALADGTLVPPTVPGGTRAQQRLADHLVHVRLPQGDGVYAPDGTLLDEPGSATDCVAAGGVPAGGVQAGGVQAGGVPAGGVPAGGGDADSERPLVLAMLGDSTSVGYGTRTAAELPGVILARGVAAHANRSVRMRSHGLTGARTTDLARQLELCVADRPDVVVILVGANDMRDLVPPWRSAAQLGRAVSTLTAKGIPVVVGTCPDFGVIGAIPQPLRSFLGTWSLRLAALQERAVVDAGGSAVALGRLVSPQFAGNPELFASDRFHPSGAGYERAMAVLLPAAIDELDGTAAATRAARAVTAGNDNRAGSATDVVSVRGPGPG